MKMLKKFTPQFLTLALLTGTFFNSIAQLNDSLLREQLTRGVQLWQQGNPAGAYMTLDSVVAQPTSSENAGTKVKAAIWTATYLQQQKKSAPALRFLDSARTWAEQYARGEEYKRVYEAYSQWHLTTGNLKAALSAKDQAHAIADSLQKAGYQTRQDSLQQLLSASQDSLSKTVASSADKKQNEAPSPLTIGLILLSVLLLFIVFRLYTNLQRVKTLPPAPQVSKVSTPRVNDKKQENNSSTPTTLEAEVAAKTITAPPLTAAPVNAKDLTVRLAEVELVLIRPDVLGKHGNGEWKAVKNLLNEYLTQLPLILKNLDDAITKSETAPILQGLEYLKPYLSPFGMSGTLGLIKEVEEESSEVKANKLLSRVFQVRNHTRRAADEAKAILEKLS